MVHKLLLAAVKEYQSDYAKYFAVAMVYYALVSLVPLLLLLLAIVGWFLRVSPIAGTVEQRLLVAVDTSLGSELRETVERSLQVLQEQSLISTVISLVGLLLTASVLIRHLRVSFRAIWRHSPPWLSGSLLAGAWAAFREKVLAFLMLLGGSLALLAALVGLSAIHGMNGIMGETVAWLVALPGPLAIVFLTFTLLFKFLPPVRMPFRHVWLAALFCTAAWVIGLELLVLYGSFVAYNVSTYGAVGGVLVIMLWLNAVSQVLFFGAELCKVMARGDPPLLPLIGPTANC